MESRFPRELEALEFARQRFPEREPYRARPNFERIAKADLLVLAPMGMFLIQSRPESDPHLWFGERGAGNRRSLPLSIKAIVPVGHSRRALDSHTCRFRLFCCVCRDKSIPGQTGMNPALPLDAQ